MPKQLEAVAQMILNSPEGRQPHQHMVRFWTELFSEFARPNQPAEIPDAVQSAQFISCFVFSRAYLLEEGSKS